jgi:uncharacterized coiled-coil protein SlyX
MFRVLELEQKMSKAYEKVKRYTYQGRPTKQRRKIALLDKKMSYYYQRFEEIEKGSLHHKKSRKK